MRVDGWLLPERTIPLSAKSQGSHHTRYTSAPSPGTTNGCVRTIHITETVVDVRIALPRRPVRHPLETIIIIVYRQSTERNRLEHESATNPRVQDERPRSRPERSDLGTTRPPSRRVQIALSLRLATVLQTRTDNGPTGRRTRCERVFRTRRVFIGEPATSLGEDEEDGGWV